MTETIADRYRRLGAAFADTIAAVPTDRWDDASPCEGWTARAVVGHVIDSQGMFLGLVGRTLDPGPPVDDDPHAAWRHTRDQIQAGLDDEERAAAEFDGYFGRTRFDDAVDRFLSFDLIVHRWDLARATGGDETIPVEDLSFIEEKTAGFGDTLRSSGAVGEPLDPPEGADDQTRLLALLGRRAW